MVSKQRNIKKLPLVMVYSGSFLVTESKVKLTKCYSSCLTNKTLYNIFGRRGRIIWLHHEKNSYALVSNRYFCLGVGLEYMKTSAGCIGTPVNLGRNQILLEDRHILDGY